MIKYSSTSPYFNTNIRDFYLDIMVNRPIPKLVDDQFFEINQTYQFRPDLLAYDLYQQPGLWWVFYQRNPNTLTSPPWDFAPGVGIYLPNIDTLRSTLGF